MLTSTQLSRALQALASELQLAGHLGAQVDRGSWSARPAVRIATPSRLLEITYAEQYDSERTGFYVRSGDSRSDSRFAAHLGELRDLVRRLVEQDRAR